jgi:hypothetical protein
LLAFPLDSPAKKSVCGCERIAAMDERMLEATLKMHLSEMRERLDRAASIAKAAETCAEAGNIKKSIEIALDVEQLIYEVNTFLNAASMIQRINRSDFSK